MKIFRNIAAAGATALVLSACSSWNNQLERYNDLRRETDALLDDQKLKIAELSGVCTTMIAFADATGKRGALDKAKECVRNLEKAVCTYTLNVARVSGSSEDWKSASDVCSGKYSRGLDNRPDERPRNRQAFSRYESQEDGVGVRKEGRGLYWVYDGNKHIGC